ncbi:Retrotransposon protein, Ty3-gypsy subclass [Gossypium australe]|uniref:Retrotransposon protein, Ty3-gypsy subclass n=1 Tax=Gossypium australe TaxID=47621 RepID=A0A5B6VWG8_9ROSI|nr:Retrotransposon protein, Ty3-gypsy subclass [Gossypium australe]
MVGIDFIRETEDKKLYADLKRYRICCWRSSISKSFSVKESIMFGRKGKLSPRFIEPYEIVERVGSIAYRLALPSELEKIHNVILSRRLNMEEDSEVATLQAILNLF